MKKTLAKRVAPKAEEVREQRIQYLRDRIKRARSEAVRLAGTIKYSQVRYLGEVVTESLNELRSYGVSESDLLK